MRENQQIKAGVPPFLWLQTLQFWRKWRLYKREESVKERRSNADAEVSKEEMSSLENARDRAVGWLETLLLASAGQLIKQFSGYHLRLLSSRHKKKCYGTVNGFLMNKHQQS